MKKILTIMGSLGLISTCGVSFVVSCQNDRYIYSLLTKQPISGEDVAKLETLLVNVLLEEKSKITTQYYKLIGQTSARAIINDEEILNNPIYIKYNQLDTKINAIKYKIIQYIIFSPEAQGFKLTSANWSWDKSALDHFKLLEFHLDEDANNVQNASDELQKYVNDTLEWAKNEQFGTTIQNWAEEKLSEFKN
ncbi:hypothetical protein SCLARK_00196 [Spiroplasma clarkii]|uniref:Lipoprotein n=1 Tax=Spiroplasma clarkii TaxID=2139 RepID=A0A1Y0KZL6_9MOLU|nr:lipoprotein [Spiroplasma clarkii]ARU90980.1 hypothetical protein SCLARK_00196 [Spiroplasma clarkii]ATX70422.1 hypothetical protein SCLAR_v1c00870 [Spiroplasma clarkii]